MTGIRQYCPKCGSEKVQSRGRQIYCNNCKRCTSVPLGDRKNIERGDNYIRIVSASARIRSVEDAIREFDIDTNEWEVKPPVRIKTSEGYRKDRTVTWKVVNGVVEEGTVEDSGKMLVVPLYHIEILFVRKTQEIRAHDLVGQLLKDAAGRGHHRLPFLIFVPISGHSHRLDQPHCSTTLKQWIALRQAIWRIGQLYAFPLPSVAILKTCFQEIGGIS